MLKKTLAQLYVLFYSLTCWPLFAVGFVLGFLGLSLVAGYYWGNKWAGELWEYATGKGETWIARIDGE